MSSWPAGTLINGESQGGGGGGLNQLTGDVTAGPGTGSQVATIANNVVTLANLAQITGPTVLGRVTASAGIVAELTPAQIKSVIGNVFTRGITVQGVIATGVAGYIRVPVACNIIKASLLASANISIVFNIFKDAPLTLYPPTTSIVASAPPTLSNASFFQDSTLTGWTKSVAAGDVIGFSVTSVTGTGQVTLQLDFQE